MISSDSRRPTVEDFRSIDVGDIKPSTLLTPGLNGIWKWSRAGEPIASMHFKFDGNAIEVDDHSADGTEMRGKVQLTWTRCPFGGRRPWFVCRCRGRVAILYVLGEALACRCCGLLGYASQYEDPGLRSIRRAHAIRRKVDAECDVFSAFPPKPLGMHWRTYDQLRDRGLTEDRRAIEGLRTLLTRRA